MAGAGLQLLGNDTTIGAFNAIQASLGNPAPLYDEIGSYLELRISERFDAEIGPDGHPWPKSLRALATGGKTLVDSARLRQSFTHNVLPNGVEVGTNVIYAAVHQFGAIIRALTDKGLRWRFRAAGANQDSWARKMSVAIPARPFLGLDHVDDVEIPEMTVAYLARSNAH